MEVYSTQPVLAGARWHRRVQLSIRNQASLTPTASRCLPASYMESQPTSNIQQQLLKIASMSASTDNFGSFLDNVTRTADFWRRASAIYFSYKGAQLKAAALSTFGGKTKEELKELVWEPQHQRAGDAMYELCITLRGFYLKAGQFIGSRSDFVPDAICTRLARLMDKVPPMSPEMAGKAMRDELGVQDLNEVFEWIDLDNPLGSASIAQVHKAKLRSFSKSELRRARAARQSSPPLSYTVQPGQSAWDVCNLCGISLHQLTSLNKGVNINKLYPGQEVKIPASLALDFSSNNTPTTGQESRAVQAVLQAQANGDAPDDGLVAVKIQYPNALEAMSIDLKNLRAASYYLSKTEIKFDLVSAVDELNKQIKLEFDFNREASVMDNIALHLSDLKDKIQVPRSVPGLVSRKLLVMHFLRGVPLLEAGERIKSLSALQQQQGKRRIMERVSEAYGRMILGEGLFQADGHPGNILVSQGGRIGLLDYGQSKQLTAEHKLALAHLIVELDRGDKEAVSAALSQLGVVTQNNNVPLRTEMAYGMFDTRGKVDPFDPKSPIKQCAIVSFPPDMFFVLRVVQLLRGMANGMGIHDFSSAHQWAPLARQAIRRAKHGKDGALPVESNGSVLRRVLKVALWPSAQLIARVNGRD